MKKKLLIVSNLAAALLFPSCGDDKKKSEKTDELELKLAPFHQACEDTQRNVVAFEKIFDLLEITGERNKENCKAAGIKINDKTELDLSHSGLTDLKFLKPLDKLKVLNLQGNSSLSEETISDLPENLTSLNLKDLDDKVIEAARKKYTKNSGFRLLNDA